MAVIALKSPATARSWVQAACGSGWLPLAPGIQLSVTARCTVAVARLSPWPTVSTSSVGA